MPVALRDNTATGATGDAVHQEAMLRRAPDLVLSLPIDGSRAWYANGRGPHDALTRVKRGAALRLQPPDRPDGPFDALTPTDDVVRVSAELAEALSDGATARAETAVAGLERAGSAAMAALARQRSRSS